MKDRRRIIHLISELDDEAFAWLLLGTQTSVRLYGMHRQIWPDDVTTFKDRDKIIELREAAAKWLEEKPILP